MSGGYTNQGTPAKINIVRSMRGAYARRLALTGNRRKRIAELEAELEALKSSRDILIPRCHQPRASRNWKKKSSVYATGSNGCPISTK